MLRDRIFLVGVVEGSKTIAFDKYGRPILRRKKYKREEEVKYEEDDGEGEGIKVPIGLCDYNPLNNADWRTIIEHAANSSQAYNEKKLDVLT